MIVFLKSGAKIVTNDKLIGINRDGNSGIITKVSWERGQPVCLLGLDINEVTAVIDDTYSPINIEPSDEP